MSGASHTSEHKMLGVTQLLAILRAAVNDLQNRVAALEAA